MSEEKLHFLAFHDSLTQTLQSPGLSGMRCIMRSQRRGKSDLEPALLFIDLDGFKAVNDVHGHETGDKLLCAVVRADAENLFRKNLRVRPLGGDEFAIISHFSEATCRRPWSWLRRLVEELGKPFEIDGSPIAIGASCGVASASEFSSDLDGLIKGADLAMYHAKSNGRGGAVLFEAQMLKDQAERRQLELDLRLAVQTNEFEIFYQPLFDIVNRTITGFEALVRWPHPKRGLDFARSVHSDCRGNGPDQPAW